MSTCPPPASVPAESEEAPPTLPPATPQETVVACVGAMPITEAMFLHWHEVATAPEPGGKRHRESAEAVIDQVMGFLISADWLLGEAEALKVHVTPAQVRRHFNNIRKLQFPKMSEFQTFLNKSKQTVPDLLFRVELDMLAAGIQHHVTAAHHRPSAQMRALKHFVSHFTEKWTAQTYCARSYAVKDCGHVQESI